MMIGESLAHYEILAKIGEGGMGTVYRARDRKLEREVALKLLPDSFATDPERLLRLEREARALASLHHPNIASIFGLEEAAGRRFLVMELVAGEDLAARIRRAPISPDEVIAIGRQIAAGLEEAHQKGIVHRDLKPANLMITPDDHVKILDFGLARAYAGDAPAETDPSTSPTISAGLTAAGVVLGTAATMSPEQARGKPVDRRTDIWAFGCVLYECLTGRPAFQGETVSDLMVAILRTEPDWSSLPAATPAHLRELLARCLRKDPRTRLRDIGDARITLEELGGQIQRPDALLPADQALSAPPRRSRGRLWPWAVAAAFLAGALVSPLLWRRIGALPRSAPPLRIALAAPDLDPDSFSAPTISLDGRSVAYTSRGRLWIRSLERFEDRAVPGSDGVGGMFWSPGGDAIGFSRDRHLWIWALESTASRMLCPIPGSGQMNGGIWMPDGRIYFCLFAGGVYAVPASGGEPELVLERAAREFDFHQPAPLPGGEEFVAVAHRDSGQQQVFTFSCARNERHPVLEMDELSTASYSPAGYLLLSRNWTTQDLWAVRFSPAARKAAGEPFLVERGAQGPSVAADGAMVYYQGDRESLFDLLWVTRDGGWELVPGGPFQGLNEPAVSPDGHRIAYSGVKDDNRDIWVLDLERGTRTRLTSDPANDFSPRWSRDGRTVFYRVWVPGLDHLWRVDAGGGATPGFLVEGSSIAPLPDGRSIVFAAPGADRRDSNLYLKPLDPGSEPESLLATEFDEDQPAVSPDGRWLAYRTNEPGEEEIFVCRLAGAGPRRQASVGGGGNPMWGIRGDALYYWRGSTLMEVPVRGGADPEPEPPRPILSASELGVQAGATTYTSGRASTDYALIGFGGSPDGRRFLIGRRSPDDPRAGILYVQGWQPPPL